MAGFQSVGPYVRSLLRLVIGFTYMCHGGQKLFGLFGGMGGSRAHILTVPWVAGILEACGGALIFVGLFTAPVAFVLCGEMAVAYFTAHAPNGIFPIQNHGELAVVYCFVFLYLCVAGPGPVSADRLIRKKG